MFLQFLMVVWLAGSLSGAPAPEHPLLSQQYVVLTSPHLTHQQIQYGQPIVKLQQPFFQQITPLGRFETPQKQNLVVLYPNGPQTQYPLLSLRQDGGSGGNEFFQGVQNFFQYIQSLGGATEAPPTSEPANPPAGGETAKLDAPANSEPLQATQQLIASQPLIAAQPLIASQPLIATKLAAPSQTLPASTELLSDRRYFILTSQPQAQFFGKYDALSSPLNTVYLQPLQTIQSRSAEPLADAEALTSPPLLDAAQLQDPIQAPAINSLQAEEPLLLRSALDHPQPTADQSASALPEDESLFKAEPLPEDDEAPREFNRALPTPDDDQAPNEQSRDLVQGRSAEPAEQSVAQAKPTGIALAGKGGIASAKPVATALVGDGGLALAAPSATAISGDFEEEDKAETQNDRLE